MENQVWVVGEVFRNITLEAIGINDEDFPEWQILGVFDDEQLAVAACTADSHFVGPMTLNERLPDPVTPWDGAYYPTLEKKAKQK